MMACYRWPKWGHDDGSARLMCGIFATTRPDLWEGRVDGLLEALDHRGPDGRGVWRNQDGTVLLGHTRLAIIGLTKEADQPLHACDGNLTITYNGEIYNYRKLAGDLGLASVTSDTMVLAETLGRWGIDGLSRLRG